ncbi:hypothetical protein BKA65DRAFT_544117 [Rhexocercosporidium sp. MPI-PUGE-AT-0058]|nr:hypothetical protein BKA65DRAFT_544117 [Rhexocercosporidium sp. MPI-PUGE-AT-0058]
MTKRAGSPDIDAPASKRSSTSPSSRSSTPDDLAIAAQPPTFHTGQDVVMVIVGEGEDSEIFIIHAGLLTYHSGYFRDILKSKSSSRAAGDAGSGTSIGPTMPKVSLPTISPSTFGILLHWLYTREITLPSGERPGLVPLAKLYLLSKKLLLLPPSTSYLYQTLVFGSIDAASLSHLSRFCYDSGDSLLEDLAVRKTMETFGRRDIEDVMEGMPERMKGDFAIAMMIQCVKLPGWSEGGFQGVFETVDPDAEFELETPWKMESADVGAESVHGGGAGDVVGTGTGAGEEDQPAESVEGRGVRER